MMVGGSGKEKIASVCFSFCLLFRRNATVAASRLGDSDNNTQNGESSAWNHANSSRRRPPIVDNPFWQ